MPFTSEQQRKFMYAKHPKLAEKFEKETPKDKKLPKVSMKESLSRRLKK